MTLAEVRERIEKKIEADRKRKIAAFAEWQREHDRNSNTTEK